MAADYDVKENRELLDVVSVTFIDAKIQPFETVPPKLRPMGGWVLYRLGA